MNAAYRIVHFSSEPWTGMRWAVAALVQHNGMVSMVLAPHMPHVACVGGPASHSLLHRTLGRLQGITDFSHLPISFGPHVTLDNPRAIPLDVQDPLKWVEYALPQKLVHYEDERTRQPSRFEHGQRFLEAHRVEQYVQRNFMATQLLGFTLAPITHWVDAHERSSDLLLMEPLVVSREKFETDLVEIATKFSAYKGEIVRRKSVKYNIKFIAYILPSDAKKQKETAYSILRDQADEVLDTSYLLPRSHLIDTIRRVAGANRDLIATN